MPKIPFTDLVAGMTIDEDLKVLGTDNVVLKKGTILTDATLHKLRTYAIKDEVEVKDRYSLLLDPLDATRVHLRQDLLSELLKISPPKREANMTDDVLHVAEGVRNLINKIVLDDKLLNFMIRLKLVEDGFLYHHGVVTCVYSLIIGGLIPSLSTDNLLVLGKAALLHDLGWAEMPYLIKSLTRNAQEEKLYREHPTYGYHISKEGGISDEVAKIIKSHHECWNGSGYPQGTRGDDIPIASRIIAVCETYDRIMRQEGLPPYQSIEYLYGYSDELFDAKVVQLFVESIPLYPLGSFVRLSTKEVGVIVNIRKNKGPRPVVMVHYTPFNQQMTPKIVDLGKQRTIFIEKVL